MADSPQPSPVAWLFSSRKGLLTVLVFVFAIALAAGIVVGAFRGSIAWKDAMTMILGTLFTAVIAAFATINGIAAEDAAKASASAPKDGAS